MAKELSIDSISSVLHSLTDATVKYAEKNVIDVDSQNKKTKQKQLTELSLFTRGELYPLKLYGIEKKYFSEEELGTLSAEVSKKGFFTKDEENELIVSLVDLNE